MGRVNVWLAERLQVAVDYDSLAPFLSFSLYGGGGARESAAAWELRSLAVRPLWRGRRSFCRWSGARMVCGPFLVFVRFFLLRLFLFRPFSFSPNFLPFSSRSSLIYSFLCALFPFFLMYLDTEINKCPCFLIGLPKPRNEMVPG